MRLVPILTLGLVLELVMLVGLAYAGPCVARQVYVDGTCLPRNAMVPAR